MGKVAITESKLDDLAAVVSQVTGVALPLTIAQMQAALEGLRDGTTNNQSNTVASGS